MCVKYLYASFKPVQRNHKDIRLGDFDVEVGRFGKNCRVKADPDLDTITKARDCTGPTCYKYNKYCIDGNCDLKIFVVWTGTDSEGNYFTSASLRFSRFAKYSINDLYASAKQNTLTVATEAKEVADQATRL